LPDTPTAQAPEDSAARFLKGLAVVDDVAYFGISQWRERSARDSPDHDCELAAFDLEAGRLLWRRQVRSSWGEYY
jgi:outer membrane protein assembly factor BamB